MRRSAILLLVLTLLVSCSPTDDFPAFTDADQNIIWVTDSLWANDSQTVYHSPFSFFITEVEGYSISGKVQIGALASPNLFVYRWENAPGLMDFTGTMDGQIAVCEFHVYQSQDKAELWITRGQEGQLEAKIDFEDPADDSFGISGQTFSFRPYNIAKDLDDRDKERDISLSINLGIWGNVSLVAGFTGNNPWAVLTNEDGDIVYTFHDFVWGFEIVDVGVEDINGDGLEDLIFHLAGVEDDTLQIYIKYIQMETGEFYSSELGDSPPMRD